VLLAASGSAQHSPQTLRELEAKAASNANDPQAILELAFGYALALLGPIQMEPSMRGRLSTNLPMFG
jgi:hypothetical protein